MVVTFKDLSLYLKIVVVWGTITAIFFGIGFFIGLILGVLGV